LAESIATQKTPPLAVGLKEAARLLGISKSLAYKLAATGEIPSQWESAAKLCRWPQLKN
jgi:predicted DNA-binding transcriptional regulator AlpA